MLRITEENKNLISVMVQGKISEDDLKKFKSSMDQKTKSGPGPYNALIEVDDFDGIEFSAIDDVLTDRPKGTFNRVAVLGDGNLEKFASAVAKPFFKGEVKHFGRSESATARQWIDA